MKRMLVLMSILLLVLCVAASAQAAEIRPLETDHLEIDLTNGLFFMGVKDVDRITDGGWFTAALYVADHYDAAQIEAMAPSRSYHLDEFKNKTLKVVDFSARQKDRQPDPTYTFIYDGKEKVIFEPNAEFVTAVKNVAPRKVFTD